MTEFDLAMLMMRIVLGFTLATHGYAKFFRGGRIAGTARWFDSMGMRPGRVHALLAAGGEVAAGLALAAGVLTSFAALGFVGLMTVAWYTVHRDKGFLILNEGWEYVAVLGATAVGIAILGPGRWSVDHAVGVADALDGVTGLVISAGGGLLAAAGLLVGFYRPPPSSAEI